MYAVDPGYSTIILKHQFDAHRARLYEKFPNQTVLADSRFF